MNKDEAQAILSRSIEVLYMARSYSELTALIDKPIDVEIADGLSGTQQTRWGLTYHWFY